MALKGTGRNKVLSYCLLIVVLVSSFLFSPRPKQGEDYCGQYISLNEHAGFVFNCDAADYCMSAKYPSHLLGDSATRQSRPLYILIASGIGYPLQWIAGKADLPLFHGLGEEAAAFVGFYAAYILINFICLLLCLLLFERITVSLHGQPINKWLLYGFFIILVSNPISKAFFWTAHQQFFSLLMPLLSIYLSLIITEQHRTLKNITWLSLFTGLLMLVYGSFIVMFLVILFASFLVDKKMHLLHTLKNGALLLLPTVIWVSYCTYLNGHYYNHEVEKYQQFVWMSGSLKTSLGSFCSAFAQNVKAYLNTFNEIMLFVIPAAVASVYLWKNRPGDRRKLSILLLTACTIFSFFMLLGFYEERLTYTLLPVLLCICCFAIDRPVFQRKPMLFAAAAVAWHIYVVLSYGPFS